MLICCTCFSRVFYSPNSEQLLLVVLRFQTAETFIIGSILKYLLKHSRIHPNNLFLSPPVFLLLQVQRLLVNMWGCGPNDSSVMCDTSATTSHKHTKTHKHTHACMHVPWECVPGASSSQGRLLKLCSLSLREVTLCCGGFTLNLGDYNTIQWFITTEINLAVQWK